MKPKPSTLSLMTSEVAVPNGARPTVVQYSYAPQDMAGLAGEMVAAGLTVLEAQQLVAHIQEVAQIAALGAAPKLLEAVRKVNAQRFRDLYRDVQTLPTPLGYVSRDAVLRLITQAMHTTPRT